MKQLHAGLCKAVFGIYKVFAAIAKLMWYISGAAIVFMSVVVAYGAIARYVFRSPVALSYDLTCILMLGSVMFALPYVQCIRHHLRLDMLDNTFPKPMVTAIKNVFGPLVGLLFAAVMTWQCWNAAAFSKAIGEVTKGNFPFPSFPVKLGITLCTGLLSIILLLQILLFLLGVPEGREDDSGSEEPRKEV